MKKITIVLALLLFSSQAMAQCKMNGKEYSTGQVVAGFTCTESGRWVRK